MNRKQSTVERIRKKKAAASAAAAPPPSPCNDASDPFHNGQTPGCRLMLDAVQDIFPELQQKMQNQRASSELGQLLRWHILKRRKERSFPPGPPLLSFSPQSTMTKEVSEHADDHVDTDDHNNAAASKKKRKKKRKKKESGETSSDTGFRKSELMESAHGGEADATFATATIDDSVEIIPLKDNTNRNSIEFDLSVHSLDRSVHELEDERRFLENTITPSLRHLPSDDGSVDDFDEGKHSSISFFEQIHQESTERDDDSDEYYDLALSIPIDDHLEMARTPPKSNNRSRLRTLSSSSIEGVVTPTTKNTAEDDQDERQYLSSPITHEWVPEESAEAKSETPPGDAIKNPLELPYLLTLSTNNGLTTTTIDGSLISAERSDNHLADQKPSSLETTKMLMEDWVGQLVDHNNKNDKDHISSQQLEEDIISFISYLQKKLRDGSGPLGIPFAQLKEAVTAIECSTCQRDALDIVNEWSERDEKKPLVLNPMVLHNWTSGDTNDVESAFDYVALEEGHHLPKPERPDVEDWDDVNTGVHMSFNVAESSAKKDGTKHLFIDQFTVKNLNALVEEWLPCGIEEDILVSTSVSDSCSDVGCHGLCPRPEVLDHEFVSKIQSLVLKNEKKSKDILDEIDQIGKDMRDDLDQMLNSLPSQPHNLDVKTFPKLKHVDQMCTDYSDKLLRALQTIDDGRSDALVHLKLRLWTAYLEALNKNLKTCDAYYCRLGEDLADGRGALPRPYVHAGFRNLFQIMLEEKVRVWTGYGKFMCDLVKGRLLRELHTRTVWYSERAPTIEAESLFFDETCSKLVQELSDWTVTIMGGNMSDIYKERMAQTERLLELLQSIIEPLAAQYASVEKYFSTERNMYFASLRSNVVLAQRVKKQMRLIDNAEVEGMATGVILMWNHVRLMQSKMINSSRVPPLPLQLKRWMLQDENPLVEEWNGSDSSPPPDSFHQRYCQPGCQGKRRAMCILAGLAYRWLQEQCKAWKAEKAEKELLTDFDFRDPSIAVSSVKEISGSMKLPKAKKSKKKKTKNVPLSNNGENAAFQENPSGTEEQNNVDLNGCTFLSPELSDEKQAIDPKSTAHVVTQDIPDVVLRQDRPESPVSSSTQSLKTEAEYIEENRASRGMITSLEGYCESEIFIQDGDKKISAQDFLVSRMRQVLLSNEVIVMIE